MDLPGSEGILSALGGAVASAAASIAAMGKRFAKRLDSVERKATALFAKYDELRAKVDGLDKLIAAGALRQLIDERIASARRKDERISQREIIVDQRGHIRSLVGEAVQAATAGLQRDIDRLERELTVVRAAAEAATPGGTFSEHLGSEADRWNEIHRTLGQIEGSLTLIRGRLKG